jgi:hypothetical protein
MGETRKCPQCGARYQNAEVHQQLHEEAAETVRRIDQAVEDRVRGRKENG